MDEITQRPKRKKVNVSIIRLSFKSRSSVIADVVAVDVVGCCVDVDAVTFDDVRDVVADFLVTEAVVVAVKVFVVVKLMLKSCLQSILS
jgi:hypothetical protein